MNRRLRVLQAVRELTKRYGYPPTVREVCEYTGLKSTATVMHHLNTLRRDGLIEWEDGKVRTVREVA